MDAPLLYEADISASAPPKNSYPELQVHKEICRYIKMVKPNVMFKSDLNSGRYEQSKFYRGLKVALNSNKAWPDLMIYAKRAVTMQDGSRRTYCGMAIEIKTEKTTIIVTQGERKGHLTSDPHIREQFLMLKELEREGWYVNFACGFKEFEYQFCWYFGLPKPDNATIF